MKFASAAVAAAEKGSNPPTACPTLLPWLYDSANRCFVYTVNALRGFYVFTLSFSSAMASQGALTDVPDMIDMR